MSCTRLIYFEFDSSGPFSFSLRDGRLDSLLIQGEIDYHFTANLSGLNGRNLINVTSVGINSDDVNPSF